MTRHRDGVSNYQQQQDKRQPTRTTSEATQEQHDLIYDKKSVELSAAYGERIATALVSFSNHYTNLKI